MAESVVVEPPSGRRVPLVLVTLLWLAWLVSVLVCAPHQDDGQQLRDDLRAHRVTAFNTVPQPPPGPLGMVVGVGTNDTDAGYLVWQEGLQRRWVDFPTAMRVLHDFPPRTFPQGTGELAVVQNRMATAADVHTIGMGAPTPVLGLGLAWYAMAVLAVVTSRPRRGTRWFWFWIVSTVGGLGALWFVVTELWRTGPVREPRHRGLVGFLVAVVVNSVLRTLGSLW